jgi:hypothetical protein
VKGLNRELAAEIRRHLDEMTALLDVEECAEPGDQLGLALDSPSVPADDSAAPVNETPVRE